MFVIRIVMGRGVAAVFLSLAFSALAQSPEIFRVVGVTHEDALNMRSAPKANAPVLGKIPADASGIVRTGECNAWCKVRYDRAEGWVDRRYLEIEAIPPPAMAAISSDPIGDCNSDEIARKLVGCSAIIKEGAANPTELAIAYSRRSDAHIQALDLDKTISDRAKAFEIQPDDVGYNKRLAEAYGLRAADRHAKGKNDGALADYSHAIRIDPSNAQYLVGRSVFFLQKNDTDKAIADLEMAARVDAGKTVYGASLARLYEDRGVSHLFKRDYDRAITDFTEALQFDPTRESLLVHRGAAYLGKKDYDRAYSDCVEASRVNPENVETYIKCGELTRRLELPHQAVRYFDEALKREPSNVTALMMRGLTHEDTKQFGEAIADYRAVLGFVPSHRLARESLTRLGGGGTKSTN